MQPCLRGPGARCSVGREETQDGGDGLRAGALAISTGHQLLEQPPRSSPNGPQSPFPPVCFSAAVTNRCLTSSMRCLLSFSLSLQ